MKCPLPITCLLLVSSFFAACKKNKTPEDRLPPITQTGAGTFGCLINGEVYTPQGFEQNKPAFDMIVDPANGGNLDIRTFRKVNGVMKTLAFTGFGIHSEGIFQTKIYPTYAENINSNICYFVNSSSNFKQCTLNISKYDLTNRIISGTFEMIMYDASISCDTIRITQGRFDKKLN